MDQKEIYSKIKIGDTVEICMTGASLKFFASRLTSYIISATVVGFWSSENAPVLGWKITDPYIPFGNGLSNTWELKTKRDSDYKEIHPRIKDYLIGWVAWPHETYIHTKSVSSGSDGMFCQSCNIYVQYAEANMPDNKFSCWSCRNYKYYASGVDQD